MGDKTTEQRDHTDESLRTERDKSEELAEAVQPLEEAADAAVKDTRARADELRESKRSPGSPREEAARSKEERAVQLERAATDAVLDRERKQRRQHFAAFLAVERDATDGSLDEERTEADETLAARDEFLATASHDVRSLLAAIKINLDMMLRAVPEGTGSEKALKFGDRSLRSVTRMERLINDLLDITSIDAHHLGLARQHTDLGRLLFDAVDSFEPIATMKKVKLTAKACEPPLFAELDDGRILQVLINLVSNAVKFTPAGGTVTLDVCRNGAQHVFTVADTGCGIAPAQQQRIFERFRQVSDDRRGLGLGLAISKGIVEAHGGKLWVESEGAGRGSRFSFSVPVV